MFVYVLYPLQGGRSTGCCTCWKVFEQTLHNTYSSQSTDLPARDTTYTHTHDIGLHHQTQHSRYAILFFSTAFFHLTTTFRFFLKSTLPHSRTRQMQGARSPRRLEIFSSSLVFSQVIIFVYSHPFRKSKLKNNCIPRITRLQQRTP